MKCNNCGYETLEQINFCPVCATQIKQPTSEVNQTNNESEVYYENETYDENEAYNENKAYNGNEAEVNQTLNENQSTQVNQTSEMNQSTEDRVTQSDNYIYDIKDWFVGNVVLIVLSSLATITSCFMNIFGLASLALSIIGLVYSNKVKNNIIAKKYDQAINDSKTAKLLFFISLGIAIFSILVTIAIIVFFMFLLFE